ncbi:hypothetical protein [Dactylosporangium sp. CA-139066]|uniref:hypothetical protein n=1 Tax=Dactylosporangium sp. CA-139066 TaxID=3239930 RepID=UPI003D8BC933
MDDDPPQRHVAYKLDLATAEIELFHYAESVVQFVSTAVASGVAGNAAYAAIKSTLFTIRRGLSTRRERQLLEHLAILAVRAEVGRNIELRVVEMFRYPNGYQVSLADARRSYWVRIPYGDSLNIEVGVVLRNVESRRKRQKST